MEQETSISELLNSINNSIQDMREHPTEVDISKMPSNLSILVNGMESEVSIDKLFSPKMDNLLNVLFSLIEKGEYQKILDQSDNIEMLLDSIFGKGSFQGPVSKTVMASLKSTVQSQKFNNMKTNLGKTVGRLRLILKNLKKAQYNLKNPEEIKKYKQAYYAIKKTLYFAARVYRARKIINKKVWKGLNNVVHEEYEIDEMIQ